MTDTLKSLRRREGLTQQTLGLAIGKRTGQPIGKSYAQKKIARFEAGHSKPSHEDMVAISEELGVEMAILETILRSPAQTVRSDVGLGISDNPGVRQLLVICPFIHLNGESSQDFQKIITSALQKCAAVMVFVPYPGSLESIRGVGMSSMTQILLGYYSHVRISVQESLIMTKLNLEPEAKQKIITYTPRTNAANYLAPPLSKIYSLTVAVSEQPFRQVKKVLHAWTKGETKYTTEIVKTPDRIYGDAHWELWLPYFGEVVTNWIDDGQIFKDDPYWCVEKEP